MFKLLGPSLKSRKSLKIIEEYYLIGIDNRLCAPRLSAYDKVIKSNGKYVVNDNDRWHGRVHIQSPVIISHQASLEISDIYKIFIENITKTTHWEDEIISVYGELLAVDESLKAIEYEGSSDWVGICLRDKGKAQLNNFNIQGMVLGVSVGEGSELTFSDSKIDRCYQGVSTFYGENDGTVVKISNTDFNFNEDYWTKSYPAISIYGNMQFSYNGGNINNFETGVLLNYNQEESVINNVNINKAGTAIDIDEASTKIENVKLEDNYCGIFATKLWALNNENIMNIDIKNCIITDNEKGIHAERFKTKINLTDTIISNSGTYGIQVQKEATVLVGENVDFENNATDVTSNVLSDILQSLAIDLIPYVGDAKGILEAFRGRDLISDSQLSSIEKGLDFLCLAEVKSVKKTLGKLDELIALRKLKNITKLADAKFIETAKFLLTNYGDEVFPHIEKYLDDFVEVFIKHGDKAVQLAVKYGDDAAGYISKYSKEAIDLIDKLGPDAIEAYKNVEKVLAKYSKLDDIGKFINESNTLAIELGRTGKKTFTSSNYADALKALYSGIAKKLSDFNAHHIFPQALFGPNKRYERYLRYQNRLININDSRLLVWWEAAEHGQKAYEYSQKWIKFFAENSNATIDEVIEFARTLAKEYGFNVKF